MLLGGMAGYLVLALAIPSAFDDGGVAFGIAYVAIVTIHATLFSRSGSVTVMQALRGLAPYNLFTALLVLAGGIAGGPSSMCSGPRRFSSSGSRRA